MRLPRLTDLLLTFALAAVSGCTGESFPDADADADVAEDEAVAAASSAIVDGAVDEGHPAVVALVAGGKAFCSGTLVSPTVVVTAAHCLHEHHVGDLQQDDLRVFFGTDVAGAGTFIEVEQIQVHPDFQADDPEQDDDVALIRLAVEAPVAPMPMAGSPKKGARLTLVGFGRDVAEVASTGVKRIGKSKLLKSTERLLVMRPEPQGTCHGDSGGTAIAVVDGVETFVGIHTRSDCVTGMIDERVDAHFASFIQPFIGAGSCIDCVARAEDFADTLEGEGGGASEDDDAEEDTDEVEAPAAGGEGCSVGATASGARPSGGLALGAALLVALAGRRRRAR